MYASLFNSLCEICLIPASMPLRQNSFLDTAYHLELNPQQYLDYILNERVKIKEYKSMTKFNL